MIISIQPDAVSEQPATTEEKELAPEAQMEIAAVGPQSAEVQQVVEQIPPADLSFSDLADLTDSSEHVAPVPAETEQFEISWEKQVPFDIKSLNEQHRY